MDAIQLINNLKLSIWSWPLEMSKDPSARTRGMSNEQLDLCFEILSEAANNAAKANQLNVGRSAREFAESGRVETGLKLPSHGLRSGCFPETIPRLPKS